MVGIILDLDYFIPSNGRSSLGYARILNVFLCPHQNTNEDIMMKNPHARRPKRIPSTPIMIPVRVSFLLANPLDRATTPAITPATPQGNAA
jgi:hypothetical protein